MIGHGEAEGDPLLSTGERETVFGLPVVYLSKAAIRGIELPGGRSVPLASIDLPTDLDEPRD